LQCDSRPICETPAYRPCPQDKAAEHGTKRTPGRRTPKHASGVVETAALGKGQTCERDRRRIFAAIDDHRFDDLPAFYTAEVQADTAVGHVSGREQLVAT
jgi:hypothetical protein